MLWTSSLSFVRINDGLVLFPFLIFFSHHLVDMGSPERKGRKPLTRRCTCTYPYNMYVLRYFHGQTGRRSNTSKDDSLLEKVWIAHEGDSNVERGKLWRDGKKQGRVGSGRGGVNASDRRNIFKASRPFSPLLSLPLPLWAQAGHSQRSKSI